MLTFSISSGVGTGSNFPMSSAKCASPGTTIIRARFINGPATNEEVKHKSLFPTQKTDHMTGAPNRPIETKIKLVQNLKMHNSRTATISKMKPKDEASRSELWASSFALRTFTFQ